MNSRCSSRDINRHVTDRRTTNEGRPTPEVSVTPRRQKKKDIFQALYDAEENGTVGSIKPTMHARELNPVHASAGWRPLDLTSARSELDIANKIDRSQIGSKSVNQPKPRTAQSNFRPRPPTATRSNRVAVDETFRQKRAERYRKCQNNSPTQNVPESRQESPDYVPRAQAHLKLPCLVQSQEESLTRRKRITEPRDVLPVVPDSRKLPDVDLKRVSPNEAPCSFEVPKTYDDSLERSGRPRNRRSLKG